MEIRWKSLSLIFSEIITRRKNASNKKYVSRCDLQLLFETFSKNLHIGWNKLKKRWFLWFFHDLTMKIAESPIFTIIFVISASKYINIRSVKKIVGLPLSEVHPNLDLNWNLWLNNISNFEIKNNFPHHR